MEVPVVRTTTKHQTTGRREHRSPIHRIRIDVGPHFLSCVDIPCLNFPDMICILKQKSISALSRIPASWGVRDFQTDHFAANVFVRWNVNHSGLRTERNRRPVLSAPQRRTELRHLAGTRLSVRIDNWPSCFRVETLVHVLPYKRFAFDKTDFAAGALEEPQISIA